MAGIASVKVVRRGNGNPEICAIDSVRLRTQIPNSSGNSTVSFNGTLIAIDNGVYNVVRDGDLVLIRAKYEEIEITAIL